ncbi:hypothetical protein CXG81DRAFT_17288 [Caulochytrium protostelioides]|uniref:Uncharacterized protein n=1 Tax=Caulochytrium protostelioides TaxID=1555241 RepID=A0A4P9XCE5_9FUNG|nr:hypothetical protein CXG81DRAFT_17288 [Caulochytrium protostelioides]|eukprot:RKP03124.1 hypothetical protein CXG81DRAFT_17288 [Caulochytrium protostelioides]
MAAAAAAAPLSKQQILQNHINAARSAGKWQDLAYYADKFARKYGGGASLTSLVAPSTAPTTADHPPTTAAAAAVNAVVGPTPTVPTASRLAPPAAAGTATPSRSGSVTPRRLAATNPQQLPALLFSLALDLERALYPALAAEAMPWDSHRIAVTSDVLFVLKPTSRRIEIHHPRLVFNLGGQPHPAVVALRHIMMAQAAEAAAQSAAPPITPQHFHAWVLIGLYELAVNGDPHGAITAVQPVVATIPPTPPSASLDAAPTAFDEFLASELGPYAPTVKILAYTVLGLAQYQLDHCEQAQATLGKAYNVACERIVQASDEWPVSVSLGGNGSVLGVGATTGNGGHASRMPSPSALVAVCGAEFMQWTEIALYHYSLLCLRLGSVARAQIAFDDYLAWTRTASDDSHDGMRHGAPDPVSTAGRSGLVPGSDTRRIVILRHAIQICIRQLPGQAQGPLDGLVGFDNLPVPLLSRERPSVSGRTDPVPLHGPYVASHVAHAAIPLMTPARAELLQTLRARLVEYDARVIRLYPYPKAAEDMSILEKERYRRVLEVYDFWVTLEGCVPCSAVTTTTTTTAAATDATPAPAPAPSMSTSTSAMNTTATLVPHESLSSTIRRLYRLIEITYRGTSHSFQSLKMLRYIAHTFRALMDLNADGVDPHERTEALLAVRTYSFFFQKHLKIQVEQEAKRLRDRTPSVRPSQRHAGAAAAAAAARDGQHRTGAGGSSDSDEREDNPRSSSLPADPIPRTLTSALQGPGGPLSAGLVSEMQEPKSHRVMAPRDEAAPHGNGLGSGNGSGRPASADSDSSSPVLPTPHRTALYDTAGLVRTEMASSSAPLDESEGAAMVRLVEVESERMLDAVGVFLTGVRLSLQLAATDVRIIQEAINYAEWSVFLAKRHIIPRDARPRALAAGYFHLALSLAEMANEVRDSEARQDLRVQAYKCFLLAEEHSTTLRTEAAQLASGDRPGPEPRRVPTSIDPMLVDPMLAYTVALHLAEMGRVAEAVIKINTCLHVDATCMPAWNLLALLLSSRKDYEWALSICQVARSEFAKTTARLEPPSLSLTMRLHYFDLLLTQLAVEAACRPPRKVMQTCLSLFREYRELFGSYDAGGTPGVVPDTSSRSVVGLASAAAAPTAHGGAAHHTTPPSGAGAPYAASVGASFNTKQSRGSALGRLASRIMPATTPRRTNALSGFPAGSASTPTPSGVHPTGAAPSPPLAGVVGGVGGVTPAQATPSSPFEAIDLRPLVALLRLWLASAGIYRHFDPPKAQLAIREAEAVMERIAAADLRVATRAAGGIGQARLASMAGVTGGSGSGGGGHGPLGFGGRFGPSAPDSHGSTHNGSPHNGSAVGRSFDIGSHGGPPPPSTPPPPTAAGGGSAGAGTPGAGTGGGASSEPLCIWDGASHYVRSLLADVMFETCLVDQVCAGIADSMLSDPEENATKRPGGPPATTGPDVSPTAMKEITDRLFQVTLVDDDHLASRVHLGISWYKAGDNALAEYWLERACKHSKARGSSAGAPDRATAYGGGSSAFGWLRWFYLGRVMRQSGRLKRAQEHLLWAMQIEKVTPVRGYEFLPRWLA